MKIITKLLLFLVSMSFMACTPELREQTFVSQSYCIGDCDSINVFVGTINTEQTFDIKPEFLQYKGRLLTANAETLWVFEDFNRTVITDNSGKILKIKFYNANRVPIWHYSKKN